MTTHQAVICWESFSHRCLYSISWLLEELSCLYIGRYCYSCEQNFVDWFSLSNNLAMISVWLVVSSISMSLYAYHKLTQIMSHLGQRSELLAPSEPMRPPLCLYWTHRSIQLIDSYGNRFTSLSSLSKSLLQRHFLWVYPSTSVLRRDAYELSRFLSFASCSIDPFSTFLCLKSIWVFPALALEGAVLGFCFC